MGSGPPFSKGKPYCLAWRTWLIVPYPSNHWRKVGSPKLTTWKERAQWCKTVGKTTMEWKCLEENGLERQSSWHSQGRKRKDQRLTTKSLLLSLQGLMQWCRRTRRKRNEAKSSISTSATKRRRTESLDHGRPNGWSGRSSWQHKW